MKDVKKIDAKLGETLLGLQELVVQKREIEKTDGVSLAQKQGLLKKLNYKVKKTKYNFFVKKFKKRGA